MEEIWSMLITHKTADVSDIERAWHGDISNLNRMIASNELVSECVALKTCNRVEVYIVSSDGKKVFDELLAMAKRGGLLDLIEIHDHRRSLFHLLRLSSGLESMMVGEDQILGQIKDLFEIAKKSGTVGDTLDLVFKKVIRVGKRVRSETDINKGSISIGSAAVDLGEEILGKLDDKKILIIGAGEIANLAGKALATRGIDAIYIANRTFERAEEIAKDLGGIAVRYDEIESYLKVADLVISATSAPHFVITREMVEETMLDRDRELLLIDIANPRDIEDTVGLIPHVTLQNIDNLRMISERNIERRKMEVEKVEQIIAEEFERLLDEFKLKAANGVLNKIYTMAEEIRVKETERALRMIDMCERDPEKTTKIINDLTTAIVSKILADPTVAIKRAVKGDDTELVLAASCLFDLSD
ncbi:MAG: glutamyl-tRNA reductase [Candidatus Syntropharchaeales archaeon]